MRGMTNAGMDRRHFLKHVAGASALVLPGVQFLQTLRAAEPILKKENKSLIILWMGGGPTQMETWDPKPGTKTGGEFKEIATAVSGIKISEVLPDVAKQMKHLAVIRSLVTNEGSHDRGTRLMNTGRPPSPIVPYPAMGAVVSSLTGKKDLALPGFIGVGGTASSVGPGFLGMSYAPFTVQDPGRPPANISPPPQLGKDEEMIDRERRRQRLFYTIEEDFAHRIYPHLAKKADREAIGSAPDAHETVYKKGYDLTISKLREVFEVMKEPPKVLEQYGGRQNRFGMGCLLARRLIEKGVSCVEVDLGGWDMHQNIFTNMRTNGGRLDQGMSGLVKDLVDRGHWQNTVVVWMGDFGRTPRINQNTGRDHWPKMSVVVGGGAIKGGQIYGSTTADGMDVKDDKCGVGDLYATIYKALGLDPATPVRDNLGRPLTIAEGKPLKGLV